MSASTKFTLRKRTEAERVEWLTLEAAKQTTMVRVLTEEIGYAAVELVRLRCEVLQLQHDNRRLTVQLVHARRMVESDAAELSSTRAELVEEMCKGDLRYD